jgi:hypothetical protein
VRPRKVGRIVPGVGSLLLAFACLATWATPAVAVSPAHISTGFGASSIPLGTTTSLSYSIGNPNLGTGLTNIGFTDNLPDGLVVGNGSPSNDCGGTLTASLGSSTITLAGANLGAGEVCGVSLNVFAGWSGIKNNSVKVTSSAGDGNTAKADPPLTVEPPPPGDRVYFSNHSNRTVSFTNLDGDGGGDVPTGAANVSNPWDVALDPADGRVYWTNPGGAPISFANLDGNGGGDIAITGVLFTGAIGVAVDPTANRLYWSDGNGIKYANLDGSGAHSLNVSGATIDFPQSLALDPVSGRLYWVNNGDPHPLSYANLDGSGGHNLTITGATVNDPYAIAVDDSTGRIYWSNLGNTIGSANLEGGAGSDLSTGTATISGPAGIAIDTAAGRIYWPNTVPSVSSVNLDGTLGQNVSVLSNGNQFAALLAKPAAAGVPAITGGSAPGSVLSCSTGAWAPDQPGAHFYRAPQSFTYQWLINGSPIGGASSSTYTAASTGNYSCAVTASNFVGSAQQASSAFLVQAASATGQRAAALKKCKKKHSKRARRKCRKKAKLLPL